VRSNTSAVQATEVHAKVLFRCIYVLLHSKWLYKSQEQDNREMDYSHFT